jgi:hypothetical protein
MARLTRREARIVAALIGAGEVLDPWATPIHAVDRAIGTVSEDSRKLVQNLLGRGIVHVRTRARNVVDPSDPRPAFHWWEYGPNFER